MDRAAGTARFARSNSGQLPVTKYLPRLLSADPLAAVEKGAGLARGVQAGRGYFEAVSGSAIFHAADRRSFQKNPPHAPRGGARRGHSLCGRFHAPAPRLAEL